MVGVEFVVDNVVGTGDTDGEDKRMLILIVSIPPGALDGTSVRQSSWGIIKHERVTLSPVNAQTAVVLVTSVQKSSSLLHFDSASTKLVPQTYKGGGVAVGERVLVAMTIQLSSRMAKHVWSAEHPAPFGQAVLTAQFMEASA